MSKNKGSGREEWLANRTRRVFKAVFNLNKWMSWEKPERGCIMQITIQSPAHTGRQWRIIAKGGSELGEKGVAYVEAANPEDLLIRLDEGLTQGFIKWREDKPYNDPAQVEKRQAAARADLSRG